MASVADCEASYPIFFILQEFCIPCELRFGFSLKTILCSIFNYHYRIFFSKVESSCYWSYTLDICLKTMKHHLRATIVLPAKYFYAVMCSGSSSFIELYASHWFKWRTWTVIASVIYHSFLRYVYSQIWVLSKAVIG
jgi:hypothetical protein